MALSDNLRERLVHALTHSGMSRANMEDVDAGDAYAPASRTAITRRSRSSRASSPLSKPARKSSNPSNVKTTSRPADTIQIDRMPL